MSIFGRRQNESSAERSAAERERARLEREARRAAREGRPAPATPPALDDDDPFDLPEPPPAPPVERDEPEPRFTPDVAHFEDDSVAAEDVEPVDAPRPDWDPAHVEDPSEPPVEPEEPAFLRAPEPAEPEPPRTEIHSFEESLPEPEPEPMHHELPAPDDDPFGLEPQATQPFSPLDREPEPDPVPDPDPHPEDPLNSPTVEFNAAEAAKQRSPQETGTFAAWGEDTSVAPPAPAARPQPPPRVVEYGDEDERPVPPRRVSSRERKLPPTPPPPGAADFKPRGRPRRGRVLGVLALVLLAGLAWLLNTVFQPFKGEGGERVTVRIPTNSTANEVGDLLAEKGVVDSAFVFTLRSRLGGAELQAGTFQLKKDSTYGDAIDALEERPPPPKVTRVTIPEGRSRREAAPLVKQAGLRGSYLGASEKPTDGFRPRRYGAPRGMKSLEGFLFPATYELKANATARSLVAKQLEAFRENVAKVSMRRARRRNLTTYEVLVIASMVEREAQLAKERPLIAAVIHNRLREGMPLGIDATIRFATRNWSRPLRQSELAIDSPYNTRRRTGLPPTPIGSPGLSSIRAAANPANVDFLFYVVKPDTCGEHNFSATDAEFQKDVAEYNRAREARGGKSPTTC